jgi:Spy/CpxP family protein refolding chaperone
MKMSKFLSISAAAALAASGLVVLKTQATETNGVHRFRGQLLEKAREKLGLTDEQVTEIKTQLAGEKDTLKSLLTKWHDARLGLREAIQAPDASESSVRVAAAKVASVEADLAVERLKLFSKISPILTSDQREKVKEFQSKIDDFLDSAINRIGDRLNSQ